MAVCIARVTATGADLTAGPALNQIAKAFVDWRCHGASDIGNQTAAVLGAADAYAHFGAGISDRSVDEPHYPWAMCLRKELDDYTASTSGRPATAR